MILFEYCFIYIGNGTNCDWSGLMFVLIAILYPILGFISALFYTVGNFDILYVFVSSLNFFCGKTCFSFNCLRYIVSILQMQWLMLNARAALFVGVGLHVGNINIFKRIINAKLCSLVQVARQICQYKNVSIMLIQIASMVNGVMGGSLALEFVMFSIGVTVVVLGYKSLNAGMMVALFFMIVCVFLSAIIIFEVGSFYYNSCQKIIAKWGIETRKLEGPNRLELRKCVKACRSISFKPGGTSAINEDLMKSYFDALLENCISLILVSKQYWAK